MATTPTVNTDHQVYERMIKRIIEQQEAIIGPVAVRQAQLVESLVLDWPTTVQINGDPIQAIDELVEQYKELFGQIAVETCKEAAAGLVPHITGDQRPQLLQ